MARIRKQFIQGKFEAFEYEVHYSPKSISFFAKELPEYLSNLEVDGFKFKADNEAELRQLVRDKLCLFETSAKEWSKYIVYRLETKDRNVTEIALGRWNTACAKQLSFDFTIIWIQEIAGKQFYLSDRDYQWNLNHEVGNGGFKPSFLEKNSGGNDTIIPHTEEMEAFFTQLNTNLSKLIEAVNVKMKDPEQLQLFVTSGGKFLN